jgi:hypothetical protein
MSWRRKLESAARWVLTHDDREEAPTLLHKALRADQALLLKLILKEEGVSERYQAKDVVDDFLVRDCKMNCGGYLTKCAGLLILEDVKCDA